MDVLPGCLERGENLRRLSPVPTVVPPAFVPEPRFRKVQYLALSAQWTILAGVGVCPGGDAVCHVSSSNNVRVLMTTVFSRFGTFQHG